MNNLTSYHEALSIILKQALPLGTETVPLEAADGRVLAETILADRDYPPFNRSAMDGYAINSNDFDKGVREYTIAETIYAGYLNHVTIAEGECFKIMTGAPVPESADVVIRREDTTETGNRVTMNIDHCKPYQHISRQGEDVRKGKVVIGQPVSCTAQVISVLAALGKASVKVKRKPSITLITTGDEVVNITESLTPASIRNSNSWLLQSLLRASHAEPAAVLHMNDSRDKLINELRSRMEQEIIITCGGVSAGDADHLPQAFEQLGVTKLFHKVAIKPGKPLWCGLTKKGGMVFGLPGNPLSVLVNFTLFLKPFLHACYNLDSTLQYKMPVKQGRKKNSQLDEFFPVRKINGSDQLEIMPFNGSGDIKAALFADGIGHQATDQAVLQPGELITFHPF